jgi:beta-glucanase (GH16 family)
MKRAGLTILLLLLSHCAGQEANPQDDAAIDPSMHDGGQAPLPDAGRDGGPGLPGLDAALDRSIPDNDAAAWQLVWSDEFEGPVGAPVDRSKWAFDVGNGGWGNAELEFYTARTVNAALDGRGALAITALREALSGSAYTSARLKTQNLFAFTRGRVEGRVQVAAGQGMWSAFWLLGNDIERVSWPACGEIDVMENLGREPGIVHGTFHGPGYSGADGPTAAYTMPAGGRYADDFHIFAIEWTADAIAFEVDGEVYATRSSASLPAGKAWVFDHPFFMLINLAVGGTWPGAPDATTVFPQTMRVDYVRVYQK